MSFRIEQKLFIKKDNYLDFYKYLLLNKAKKKYPSRKINSIYFDNDEFKMHLDGEEGIVPRKKLRIRNYNSDNNFFLEKKISSAEGRFKISKKIHNPIKYIDRGIFDTNYGLCKPRIRVSYYRSYVRIFDFNITIDRHINYEKYTLKGRQNIKKFDPEIIVEVKTNDLSYFRDMDVIFPFQTIRFSKYSKGINEIYG